MRHKLKSNDGESVEIVVLAMMSEALRNEAKSSLEASVGAVVVEGDACQLEDEQPRRDHHLRQVRVPYNGGYAQTQLHCERQHQSHLTT